MKNIKNMNLFINAVSASGMLIVFDKQSTIIAECSIEIKWNESSKLTCIIDKFLTENKLDYTKIENIVVVHGPGSFTGVRAICLIVNTIAFSTNTLLTPMSYFELFRGYPITKQSSKRDMFIQEAVDQDIKIMSNEQVVKYLENNNIDTLCWERPVWWGGQIVENIDYCDIIKSIKLDTLTQIEPLYIKKPSIW